MGKPSNVLFNALHNTCCDYDEEKIPKLSEFKSIFEFMKRLPIQKALTNQHLVFKSHIKRFWEKATYDEESKVINSVVELNGEIKPIIISEALIREVLDFPDDVNSPTKFPERMVKGCMLRMGYNGSLNSANYLKSNFSKPYKFLIHSVLQALSHRKGGYDAMRDYQMNMVTALVLNKKYNFSKIVFHYMVENITSKSKTWVYPRFVQMILDHAYPDLEKDENNDLLVLSHMDNESVNQFARYHPNHPEPSTKAEFFGLIKDKNYEDPDPVNHQNWRNEKEMKEKSYADELKILADFKETRNEWFLKEKKKRSRKATPKVQVEEGSSSQPKKRQKKVVKTLLVDESEEEAEAETEAETEVNVEGDVRMSPESANLLRSLTEFNAEPEKVTGDEGGENVDQSSSSSSYEEIDENERAQRVQAEIEKEKQLKRKRREDKDDEYTPSQEEVQTSPTSGGKKKATTRKRVVTPKKAKTLKILLNKKLIQEPSQPSSPPPEPTPHLSPPQHEQPIISSSHILQTPPSTQPPIQTTPGSTSLRSFPRVHKNYALYDISDFSFVNGELVKKLEKKVEEVLVDNKRLLDREKKLEKRVKSVEAENSSLLKKIEVDEAEIDVMKVQIAELLEEKSRRDEQNKYFELKNRELEAVNARRNHEDYMLNKVLENLFGKIVEQKLDEIQVELRARRQAEIDADMKNKGKGVEGSSEVTERAVVLSTVPESPIPNPRLISAISAIFEEDVLLDDVNDDEEIDEDDDLEKDDADDDVFSACSHSDDDNDDDDDQGTSGIKITETSNEEKVDDYLHDDIIEKSEVEEGEIRHTYTMNDIIEMTRIDDPNFKFDFEKRDRMLRGKFMKEQAEERKKAVVENEKLRKLLLKKPKQREEKFKSL